MNKIEQNKLKTFLLFCISISYFNSIAQTVTTFAGSTQGYVDGIGTLAEFANPRGVAVASDGTIFVADINNHRIRKITSAGVVTTFAGGTEGFANGTGTSAKFDYPGSIAVSNDGTVYVADVNNNRIRKITPAGVVTTLAGSTQGYADGNGTSAQFNIPQGLCVGNDGNVYVADYGNNRIRKITPTGVVTTLAGSTQGYADGNGTSAQFYYPSSVAVSTDGTVYVCDTQNHRIRKITPAGLVTTFSGSSQGYSDGIGASAQFNSPSGIAVLSDGTVFVCDGLNNRIRKIISDGTVTTLAGSVGGFLDGVGTSSQFSNPYAIAFASDGTAYVADFGNNRIRKITNVLSVSNFDLESNVLIYPNPFSSNLIIELNKIIATKYDIYDIHGKLLLSENIVDNNIVINTNNFCLGIYLVEIKTDKGIVSKKIIKQ